MPEAISTEANLKEIILKVPLLSKLAESPKALQALAEKMQIKNFAAGYKLIQESELGNEFFVLIQGQVSIYKKTPDGDEYKVIILKSDKVPAFGEGGLVEAEPRSATVTCDVACVCLVLSRDSFESFCDQYPMEAVPILRQIARLLMGRLRQTSHDLMLLHKALMTEIRG